MKTVQQIENYQDLIEVLEKIRVVGTKDDFSKIGSVAAPPARNGGGKVTFSLPEGYVMGFTFDTPTFIQELWIYKTGRVAEVA